MATAPASPGTDTAEPGTSSSPSLEILSSVLPLDAPSSYAAPASSGGITLTVASGLNLRHSRVKVSLPMATAITGGSSLTGMFQLKGAAFNLPSHFVTRTTVGRGWSNL
nr:hypothetical protein [Conexivisphaera calida]